MIPMVQIIALVFMPVLPVTSTTPWHEEQIEEIDHEPTLEELERELRPRLRILEICPVEAPE